MPEIGKIVGQLTLEEKAALCSGISSWETTPIKRLGIPPYLWPTGRTACARKEKTARACLRKATPPPAFLPQ